MPISWIIPTRRTQEMHVVAGRPLNLGWWMLHVRAEDGWRGPVNRYLESHSDISVRYEPLFRGTPDGNLFRGHGVTVNTRTGNIAVQHDLPEPRLRNFIVRMTVVNDAGGQSFTQICRVHVHERIERIWFTPPELHIRRRAVDLDRTGYYFSLRAEFADGSVGDLTNGPYLTYTSPNGQVDSDGELFIRQTDPDHARITIGAHVTYSPDTLHCEGTLVVLPPWGAGTERIWAELATTRTPLPVPETQADAEAELRQARNVLILCDGFMDRTEFNTVADSMIEQLKEPIYSPFNHLKHSIRFWRAFIPSRQADISIGAPIAFCFPAPGAPRVHWAIPPPMAPPTPLPATRALDEREVVFLVGLPGPEDAAGEMDDARRTLLRARWQAHYGQDPWTALGTTDVERIDAIERWRSAGNWGYADEIDSVLGVGNGSDIWRSNLNSFTDLLSYRLGRARMNDLIASIVAQGQDRSGNTIELPVGRLFVPGEDGVQPPDADMVCILVPSVTHESNMDGYFFTNVGWMIEAQARANSRVFDIVPAGIPATARMDVVQTFVHELCHSLHLGDEHAQFDSVPNRRVSGEAANLMDEADVLDAAGAIIGQNVRWRWHRIRCAGVVDGVITVNTGTSPSTITIPIRPGDSGRFMRLFRRSAVSGRQLILHLRARHPGVPLPAFPPLSVPLRLLAVSDNFLIAQPTGTLIDYPRLVSEQQFTSAFPEGAIAYVPRENAIPPVMSRPPEYAELLAPNVLDFMNTEHLPFTPWPSAVDPRNVQVPIIDPRLRLRNGFAHMRWPRIVGLYSGGALHERGVFHATGFCMMRMTTTDNAWYPLVGKELCAICKYTLTDLIDPSKHGAVDDELNANYPY